MGPNSLAILALIGGLMTSRANLLPFRGTGFTSKFRTMRAIRLTLFCTQLLVLQGEAHGVHAAGGGGDISVRHENKVRPLPSWNVESEHFGVRMRSTLERL